MTEPVCPYHAAVIAAILTGGQARRFHGRDKSRLVIDGRPILERQLELVGPVVSATFIVTSAAREAAFASVVTPDGPSVRVIPDAPSVRVIVDRYPDTGPIGAVLTALESTGEAVLALAGDMPGVTRLLVDALTALHDKPGASAATVPSSDRGLEPLCAIYDQAAAPVLRAAIEAGQRSLQAVLPSLAPRVLDREAVARLGDPGALFRNINSANDLTA